MAAKDIMSNSWGNGITMTYDTQYKFFEMFDAKTGLHITHDRIDTGTDPFQRSYPSLLDVGIMGTCVAANVCPVGCYQGGAKDAKPNMTYDDFASIIDQVKGLVFQCLEENEVVFVVRNGVYQTTRLADVSIGNVIACPNGTAKITNIKRTQSDDVYKVSLSGGREILATGTHRFSLNGEWEKVSDISIGDQMQVESINSEHVEPIDLVKIACDRNLGDVYFVRIDNQKSISASAALSLGIDYTNARIGIERSRYSVPAIIAASPELFRLLGYYVANGSKRSFVIGELRRKMYDDIVSCIGAVLGESIRHNEYSNGKRNVFEMTSRLVNQFVFDNLLGCRVDGVKTVPPIVMSAPRELKLEFLTGLFSDGSMYTRSVPDGDAYNSVELSFDMSDQLLFNAVCMLLKSVGTIYSVSTEPAHRSYYSKEERWISHRKRYRIRIYQKSQVETLEGVTRYHRNHDKFVESLAAISDKYSRGYISDVVTGVEKMPERMSVVDIEIDSASHAFITSHGIVSHNCALGGRGDPNTHPDFARMLYKARMEGVVPNYTTSGLTLNLEASRASAEHCGAVAVSWHNQKYTYDAIDMLQAAGCVTNIHFVLSNESVEYATSALRNGLFPNVNAVIFLLHKPVGLGMTSNVLKSDDRRLVAFFKAIEEQQLYKIGFDSCSIQGVMRLTNKFNLDSMDTCEGARFSMYISPDMYATPCSFDKDLKWGVSLRDHTISEAWESDKFESFRQVLRNGSAHCEGKCAFWTRCTGACPIVPEITLCD
jgi:radical SAM protein with 4Fe4S-binding SPASM domain